MTVGSEEARGQGENLVELLDGTEGDDVGGTELTLLMLGEHGFLLLAGMTRVGKTSQDGSRTLGYYIDLRQCKGADYLAEESGFLVIGFDERQVDLGRPDFYRKSGESSAGAEIDDAGRRGWFS